MTSRSLITKVFALSLGVLVLFGIGAAWQLYKSNTRRPGEAILRQFAPQSTALAVTLDIKPSSFEQGQALQRIQSALKKEQLNSRIQNSLHKLSKDVPIVQDVLPFLTGSGAILAWENPDSNNASDGILVLGISSDKDVVAVLQRNSDHTSTEDGKTFYHIHLPGSSTDITAILSNHNLLVGQPSGLRQASLVQSGKLHSLATDSAFIRLRKILPADANLLYYMSPSAVRQALNAASPAGQNNQETQRLLQKMQPACFSITLRQGGIQFDSAGRADSACIQPIVESAPIDPHQPLRIPANPLGMYILSQPGKYIEAVEATVQETGGDTLEAWNRGVADTEKQTGIRLHQDVLPALDGKLTIAAYPGTKTNTVDLLLLVDTTENARPAELADKVRDSLERADRHMTFNPTKTKDATLWALPDQWNVNSLGATDTDIANSPRQRIAEVNHAFLAATSSDLLGRAVSAYYKSPQSPLEMLRLPEGSKSVFVLQLGRILDMLRPNLEAFQKQHPDRQHVDMADVQNIFGDAPLVGTVGYRDQYFTGSMLIPLHYETAVKLARQVWDLAETGQDDSAPGDNGG
jgi:hypothetical protein